MKIIDTHSHPQFPQYDADREQMLRRAADAGIGMICVGTDFETSRKAIELAEQHPTMWASVGLHPNDNLSENYDQELYFDLAQHPKVVAIGEVGLDYYRTKEVHHQKIQRERFEQQISLAAQLSKPLIIHCRDPIPVRNGASAHEDVQAILEAHQDHLKGGVIHSFTGTYADAKKYISLGWHIGLNGIITFARDYDDTIENIPLERILLETDAPYLTPEPYRGKQNEPSYIIYIAEQIGRLRRIPTAKVCAQTLQNAEKLFNLR